MKLQLVEATQAGVVLQLSFRLVEDGVALGSEEAKETLRAVVLSLSSDPKFKAELESAVSIPLPSNETLENEAIPEATSSESSSEAGDGEGDAATDS